MRAARAFRQLRIGCNHADSGVFASARRLQTGAAAEQDAGVSKRAVRVAHSSDDFAGGRVDDVADGVHSDQRCDDQPVGQSNRRGPDARFRRSSGTAEFSDCRTRSGADASFGYRSGGRDLCRFVSAVSGRSNFGITANAEVEQNCRRHNRHFRWACGPADSVFFEPANRSGRCFESKRAAARQHDRVHLVDHVEWIEQVGFAGAGRTTALRDTTDRIAIDHNHGDNRLDAR
jgi:hypothetical protein